MSFENYTNAALLTAWREARDTLKPLVEREREMRDEVIKRGFAVQTPGTRYLDLGEGWRLKAVFAEDYSIDRTLGQVAYDTINARDATLSNALFKFKPELSVTQYKELAPDWAKLVIAPALTIKPKAPSLEIVPPKAK